MNNGDDKVHVTTVVKEKVACMVQAAARSPREPENVDTSAARFQPPSAAGAGAATSRAGPRPLQGSPSTAGARAPSSAGQQFARMTAAAEQSNHTVFEAISHPLDEKLLLAATC